MKTETIVCRNETKSWSSVF